MAKRARESAYKEEEFIEDSALWLSSAGDSYNVENKEDTPYWRGK